ncbi:MAG: phosphoribosyl-AMP cyclohydrolase [Thermomicrobiales bacterium]
MSDLRTDIHFGADGLVPVVAQDAVTGDVLMLAYMNDEALRLTAATGHAHYWSRGRRRLWRKGETSGHAQIVDEIRINCERNSLLLLVRQSGAVCHDGYATCFYRRVGQDGTLTVIRDRSFDPADVYGALSPDSASDLNREIDPLAEATRRQFGAYAYLRDRDLTAESSTSRRLRNRNKPIASRIADELRELAGVLDGAHRHADRQSDLLLEASQVIYWVLLQVLREDIAWSRLRPDRALANSDDRLPEAMLVRLLHVDAGRWANELSPGEDLAAAAHATLTLVGQACQSGGLDPLDVVTSDLAELEARPYLAAYFGGGGGEDERQPDIERTSTT